MDWLVYSLQPFSSANFSRAMFFHPNMHAKQNTSVKNTIYTPYARRKREALEEITGDLLFQTLLLEASWTRRVCFIKNTAMDLWWYPHGSPALR